MKTKLLIMLILLSTVILIAETNERFFNEAKKYYVQGDYETAQEWFKLSMKNTVVTPDHHYWMGKTYIALQEYELAYEHLKIYTEKNFGANAEEMKTVLEIIENQIELTKMNNNIYTLGKIYGNLNSEDSDFAPVISNDGKTLYFTSLRNAELGKENVWKVMKSGEEWINAKLIKSLSSNRNESLGSYDEKSGAAYLFGNYLNDENRGDIYLSRKSGKDWSKPSLIAGINTEAIEIQPYVFEDRIMFFVSGREGGFGQLDIYVSEYMDGEWMEPENLGEIINTDESEQTPFLDWDGNTLYFASDGHPGLGGLDLFKAEKIGETWQEWTEPENLGLVVNSVKDDRYFYKSPYDETQAFIVSNRFEGLGHDDIYKLYIVPQEEEPEVFEEFMPEIIEAEVEEALDTAPVVLEIRNINFKFDSAELTPESFPVLDDLAQKFLEYPELMVEISGHTDYIGTEDYNQKLSLRRAQSVIDYLVSVGVYRENLISKGFGETMPVADNETDEGRAKNRRVEMKVADTNEDVLEYNPEVLDEEPMEVEVIELEEPEE